MKLKCWLLQVCVVVILLLSCSVSSAQPGSDVVDPIWGINIHARYSPQEASMVASLGTPMICFSYEWEQIEQTEGVYTYEPPPDWEYVWESTMTAEEFLIYADGLGIRLNWLLQLGTWDIAGTPNEWYLTPAEQATITTSKKIQDVYGTSVTFMNAFGDYCYEVSNHFGSNGLDLVHDWELWGEPNSSHPDRAAAADVYMNLINVAVPRLREGDPLGKISGPNVSRMDFPFIERCLERGLADLVDRISIHPYREWTYPEDTDGGGKGNSYAEEIAYLRSRIETHSPGSDVEIAVTEHGYKTGLFGITELDKAKYLARTAIQNLALGIDLFIWYQLGGDGFALRSLAGESYYDSYYTYQRVMEHFSGELTILDVEMETSVSVPSLHSYFFMNENEELIVCFWQAIDAVDSYSGIVTDVTFTFPGLVTDSEGIEFKLIDLVSGFRSTPGFVRDGDSITFQNITISDSPKIIKPGAAVETPAGKYIYTWGGGETEPQSALVPEGGESETDNFWDLRTDFGTTLWELDKSILQCFNPASESAPELTMTIPGDSVDAGTYDVLHVSGHPSFASNVRIGTEGDFVSGGAAWSWDDDTTEFAVAGELVHDGVTDIIIMASGLPGNNGRTWLDAIMLDLTSAPTPSPTPVLAVDMWLLELY